MSSNSNLQELKFKILIIGDSAVGKTSILLKYLDNFFPQEHIATIGVEFRTKTLIKGKFKINLNIWDTAGQERFKSLTKSFFSGATGVVFVYDITRRDSFSGVKSWIKDFEDYGKYDRVLCGNKLDLEKKREVNFDELKEYGMKKKIEIMEISQVILKEMLLFLLNSKQIIIEPIPRDKMSLIMKMKWSMKSIMMNLIMKVRIGAKKMEKF